MSWERLTVGPVQENTYVLWNKKRKESFLIREVKARKSFP